jgi:hypothetical protein
MFIYILAVLLVPVIVSLLLAQRPKPALIRVRVDGRPQNRRK